MATAIIGAGLAGLSAARALKAAGRDVVLFDKGRGPGGRMSTRRAETPFGQLRWDHGAQFFTARTSSFQQAVVDLRATGALTEWTPRLADIRRSGANWTTGIRPVAANSEPIYVGTPSMNAVIKALAAEHEVEWGKRVASIEGGRSKRVLFEDGSTAGPFDTVICAVPAEQAAVLLEGASGALAGEAARAVSAPCWAVMLAFEAPVPVSWDGAKVSGGGLAWVARNSAKPDRGEAEAWVLHASPDWSRVHVDHSADEVAARLVAEFRSITGAPAPAFSAAHRWLYAKIEAAAENPFGWDADARIAAVGDWRLGPRVEHAWTSGQACAEFLLSA